MINKVFISSRQCMQERVKNVTIIAKSGFNILFELLQPKEYESCRSMIFTIKTNFDDHFYVDLFFL